MHQPQFRAPTIKGTTSNSNDTMRVRKSTLSGIDMASPTFKVGGWHRNQLVQLSASHDSGGQLKQLCKTSSTQPLPGMTMTTDIAVCVGNTSALGACMCRNQWPL